MELDLSSNKITDYGVGNIVLSLRENKVGYFLTTLRGTISLSRH